MSGSHLALYRKYRPETFAQVVGQENAVKVLTSAIAQKKVSHAYLFCGGRGTGKTTAARIFARDIGCNPEDIIEIDAASNRGIDEIRELRDAVRTSPFSSPYKVYIVDEAHMLTKEAANALLKTLEEPPSHVVFILATTDPEKLPATIISRCQKIVFVVPSLETLTKQLIAVANQEGKSLTDESALLIARHGKGSYRDALGLLEQVLGVSPKIVTYEDVASFVGQPEHMHVVTLVHALGKKDAPLALATIKALHTSTNALRTYDSFLDVVRNALIGRIDEKNADKEESIALGKEYALSINSKLILSLLESRHLVTISDAHGWVAFESILLAQIES